jgi:hypothetical protein
VPFRYVLDIAFFPQSTTQDRRFPPPATGGSVMAQIIPFPRAVDCSVFDEIEDPLHYRLMTVLQRFADRDGEAWPAVRTLAELVKKPRSTVHDALAAMEDVGYVAIERRPNRSNLYRLAERFRRVRPKPDTVSGPDRTEQIVGKPTIKERGAGAPSAPPPAPTSLCAPDGGSASRATPPARERPRRRTPIPSIEKTPLPDGWLPPDDDLAYALERITDHDWLEREILHFRERHRIPGSLSADWQLEWRRWIARGLAHRECQQNRRERRRQHRRAA